MLPKSEVDHADDLAQWVEHERAAIAQWEEAHRAAARDSLQAFTLRLNKRLAAARERTLDKLLGVLGVPSRDVHTFHVCTLARQAVANRPRAGGPRVSFACSVWHDATVPLRPAYRDIATEWYESVIRPVNFHQQLEEAKEQINARVAALTNDLIPTLIGRDVLSHLTDLVLANAIYFKAKWNKPFDEERHLFHRLDNTAIDTPFMRGFGRQRITWHNGFKVLQLRYEQGHPLPAQSQPQPIYSMCVFLPNARDGLCWLANQIACDPDFLHKHLPRSDVEVDDFRLPTFKVSFDMTMNDILRNMGLKEALEPGKADLSDVAEDRTGGRRRLALQEVIRRAVIEVNEEGTEAVAATMMITCSTTSALPLSSRRVAFVADHPFAFFVIEEMSGAIMFAGHVVDPTIN
ncbi:hypothetical protein ACQJBY_019858 [Aegilops geniculata]